MRKSIVVLYFILSSCIAYAQLVRHVIDGQAQGTTYRILYYAQDSLVSKVQVDSVLRILDTSMSLYDKQSVISSFNRADRCLELDDHMSKVVKRALDLNRLSNGVFDITVKPLVDLWGFGADPIHGLPRAESIDSVLHFVGTHRLTLEDKTLKKTDKRVEVDLNGIAQGYSVDVISDFLIRKGVSNHLVELGGEIKMRGYKTGKLPFEIAIEGPHNGQFSSVILQLTDKAVTTSGNYRYAFNSEGKHIHHHISPHDGHPVQNKVASVTVIAATAMDADGFDNIFMALPPEEGIRLANKLEDIDVYIIYKDTDQFKEAFSTGFYQYIKDY